MNKKFAPFIFASIMAISMGFFVSFFLTWLNTGYTEGFFIRWMRAFGVGSFVAFPISLTIAPFAQKFVNMITKEDNNN